ncbi:Cof-type HAD-IIB family hydrolase [Metabacillus sp. GX 13764]|uniref:Cof-type HAD-IIB family hydrolase n=1 Tax=Metabacillus kandeliae TaxID=2900151 RepID=UPI001E609D91|nr:Cof-type HAD-IIB family hydrolase [Metabacillus kandeliae]MCD7033969.1 Cof-type HAD-IIB family hydrolase [Metabacillus kandeliae]
MKEKVIFFDIDGTLLDFDKKIPASTKKAVQDLKDAGHHVAIATGRAPFMFADLLEELDLNSFVSFNGQYVVFEGDVIYKNPLSTETLEKVLEFSRQSKNPLVFMNHETMMATEENHPYIRESMGTLKFSHPSADPDFFRSNEIYQTLLFCDIGEEEKYKKYEDLNFIRWHHLATDILPMGGSKAEGIKKLIARLPFEREDIYAFGDGLNDLEMISFAGTGIAMGNAEEKLKEIADFVTKPVDQNGIAFAVEQLGLVKPSSSRT